MHFFSIMVICFFSEINLSSCHVFLALALSHTKNNLFIFPLWSMASRPSSYVFSPQVSEWKASCTEACPACFGWRAVGVRSDVRSAGCHSVAAQACPQYMQEGDRGPVWTCLSESREEDRGRESGSMVHPEAMCVYFFICAAQDQMLSA